MDEITISLVALIASFVSLGWQGFTWKKQHDQSRLNENLASLAGVKMHLAEIPTAYRFHGITQEMLDEHEVSEKELAYLVANFMSGQIYYDAVASDSSTPFPDDDYRATMCKTESVKKAWPLVKRMLDNTPYRSKVEITIAHYHS